MAEVEERDTVPLFALESIRLLEALWQPSRPASHHHTPRGAAGSTATQMPGCLVSINGNGAALTMYRGSCRCGAIVLHAAALSTISVNVASRFQLEIMRF